MKNHRIFALLACGLFGGEAVADQPADGFGLSPLAYPGQSRIATRPGGDVVSWDGSQVLLSAPDGTRLQVLASFDPPVYPSFVRIDPTDTFALIGESSNGDVLRVDFAGGGAAFVANVWFNFDAAFENDTTVLLSAATGGFFTGNDLVRLDLVTGVQSVVAQVGGPSGPIALDDAGNLYYATQDETFPARPGSTDVLRWNLAELGGASVLTEADAQLYGLGFSGGSSLAFDREAEVLYMASSSLASGGNSVLLVNGTPAASKVMVEGTFGRWIADLELELDRAPAEFEPYQPASGGILRYSSTDFQSVYERTALEPKRGELSLSGPGLVGPGSFSVDLAGGGPDGQLLLAFAPQSATVTPELALQLEGLPPLFFALDLGALFLVPGSYPVDASGAATASFANPGGLEGGLAIQGLLLSPSFAPLGTTTAALN
ncbi:MAG: hypothetical protein AAF682_02650 [Planctomycetota bacterium]